MIKKKSLVTHFNEILVKKTFIQKHYSKYYIRNEIVDTSQKLLNFNVNNKNGFSLYQTNSVFLHVRNNKFTFNLFADNVLSSIQYVNEYYTCLSRFLTKNKNKFILLKTVKGGFKSYFYGLIGTIPKQHIHFLIKKYYLKKKKFFFNCSFFLVNRKFNSFKIIFKNILLKRLRFKKTSRFIKKTKKFKKFEKRKFKSKYIFFCKNFLKNIKKETVLKNTKSYIALPYKKKFIKNENKFIKKNIKN